MNTKNPARQQHNPTMRLTDHTTNNKLGVPPTEKVGVGLSAASPRSYLPVGFSLQSLTRRCIAAFTVIFCITLSSHAQQPTNITVPNQLQLPKINIGDVIINHFAYSLSYNQQYKQANWVAYLLTKEHLTNKVTTRKNNFKKDPLVTIGSSDNLDYKNSGYDRGHLAPAADMLWAKKAMEESFYYSNMSPQVHAFNAGIWSKLEDQVRAWAINYDSLYIVTGPVFTQNQTTIGYNQVAVPTSFYKVVLIYKQNDVKVLGFVLPNEYSKKSLKTFTYSIDYIEQLTGIDFYPALPDSIENIIEATNQPQNWQWKTTKSEEIPETIESTPAQRNVPLSREEQSINLSDQ